MQRFDASDLERLETYLLKEGFSVAELKLHYKAKMPPFLALELAGRGNLEGIHKVLGASPFLLSDMSSKKMPDGLSVRLKLSQRVVVERPGYSKEAMQAEAEMSEGVSVFGTQVDKLGEAVKRLEAVPEMGE